MKYILALDQGTTSSRAILLNHRAQIVSLEQLEFPQHYPQPGWVEHDAMDIWRTQLACARNCLRKAGVSPSEVSAIGVTNQRETTVVWDKTTGLPGRSRHRLGRIAARRPIARNCSEGASRCSFAKRRAFASIRIFQPPRSAGFSTAFPVRVRAPSEATWLSAPSTRGSYGSSPAAASL